MSDELMQTNLQILPIFLQLSSFAILQDWVSGIDIHKFEILLCIGNKADLLPGHFAHAEYRRHLQNRGESSSDPHPEYLDYGIVETEGSSLLGDEEPSFEIRRSCLEWCSQRNIEYIEACASNADFDKCKVLLCLFSTLNCNSFFQSRTIMGSVHLLCNATHICIPFSQ